MPGLNMLCATAILVVLLVYETQTTWPGLAIVLAGIPAYYLWQRWRPGGCVD